MAKNLMDHILFGHALHARLRLYCMSLVRCECRVSVMFISWNMWQQPCGDCYFLNLGVRDAFL